MVYRNDVDALAARHQALEAELADRVRERDDVARLLADARAHDAAERARMFAAQVGPPRRQAARLAIAVAVLVVVAGGMAMRARVDRRAHRFREVTARFERYAEQVCQCSTNACAQRVIGEMSQWASQVARDQVPMDRIDDASLRRVEQASERLTRCMTTAASSSMTAATAEATTEPAPN